MKRLSTIPVMLVLFVSTGHACGGGNGEPGDAAGDEGLEIDGRDQVADSPEAEAIPDVPGDDGDTPAEGSTACEEAGGYCAGYAVVPDPCITCTDRDGTHTIPAPPADAAMGCPLLGEGSVPWCCVPHEAQPFEETCVSSGGECYWNQEGDPCPMGWTEGNSCGTLDYSCCTPGASCI